MFLTYGYCESHTNFLVKDFVLSVALSPDGEWVLSGSKDRGVQFWNPQTGDAQLMLQGHKNSVISVAPSPSPGGLFATGSGDMRARIWRFVYPTLPIWFLTNIILDSRDTTPLAAEQLGLNDMFKFETLGYLRTLFSFLLSFADSLVVHARSVCIAAMWHTSA